MFSDHQQQGKTPMDAHQLAAPGDHEVVRLGLHGQTAE
jgi:hypothetical protein